MDYMRIYRLTENDFDGIISAAGGKRLSSDDSRENQPNADYLLDESIIELKFVEEEGLEKKGRQQKLAAIFREQFPNKPVIVLSPKVLSEDQERQYYHALATPIKTHIKKAADQLEQTGKDHPDKVKVVILVNAGYGSLYHEEFKEIAINRATNDTQQIDSLVVGGIYFYGDGFDYYVLCQLEEVPIHINKRFAGLGELKKQWNIFVDGFMTSVMRNDRDMLPERLPVLEIEFEVDGVRYVKPAPPMGVPSEFWTMGRPRKNSTATTKCPHVGIVFPKLDKENWERFRGGDIYDAAFRQTYAEWLKYAADIAQEEEDELRPFVAVEVSYEGFCQRHKGDEVYFVHLCEYAAEVFQEKITKVIESAVDQAGFHLILPEYILLVVEEIGQDKANDLSSIYHVRQFSEREEVTTIFEYRRLFFDYGLCLASSYALKHGIDQVIYKRDQKYMWR
jgi:hypothetical protein